MAASFYDLSEKDANGNVVSFEKFRGKVVYGVNVASKVKLFISVDDFHFATSADIQRAVISFLQS